MVWRVGRPCLWVRHRLHARALPRVLSANHAALPARPPFCRGPAGHERDQHGGGVAGAAGLQHGDPSLPDRCRRVPHGAHWCAAHAAHAAHDVHAAMCCALPAAPPAALVCCVRRVSRLPLPGRRGSRRSAGPLPPSPASLASHPPAGTIDVLLLVNGTSPRLVVRTLQPGDVVVIPRGVTHCESPRRARQPSPPAVPWASIASARRSS